MTLRLHLLALGGLVLVAPATLAQTAFSFGGGDQTSNVLEDGRHRVTAPGDRTSTVPTTGAIAFTSRDADGRDVAKRIEGRSGATGSIGDFVWNDVSGDRLQDAGEFGIGGVIVFIDTNGNATFDSGELSDTTDPFGAYDLTDLAAGTYNVTVDASSLPAGLALTTGNTTQVVNLAAGEDFNDADFGFRRAFAFVDASVATSGDGSSWAQAFQTLTEALAVAAAGQPTVIRVAEGVYTPSSTGARTASFDVPAGVQILGGYPAGGGARDRIPNDGVTDTVLSGDIGAPGDASDNSFHVVRMVARSPAITPTPGDPGYTLLDGLTVSGGNADGSGDDGSGGGLRCDGTAGNMCNPALAHVAFTENTAAEHGGAVFADGSSAGLSSPVFTNATFAGNSAGSGGAVYADGFAGGQSSPVFTNATFAGNSASTGGAVYADGNVGGQSSPVFTNATFAGNSASTGGAVFAIGMVGQSSPRFENSILWGNTATSEGGEVFSIDATPQFHHAVVEGGCGSIAGATCTDVIGHDPRFVDASDPAGPDGTIGTADDGLALLPASPAIDVGDLSFLPADTFDLDGDSDTTEPLPLDLAGNERQREGGLDLGAYEAGPRCAAECFVDAAAGPGGDGLTWGTAFASLSDALAVVDRGDGATAGGVVRVAEGVYTPSATGARDASFRVPAGVQVLGGYARGGGARDRTPNDGVTDTVLSGDYDGDDAVTRDAQTGQLTFSDNDENALHVVTMVGSPAITATPGDPGYTLLDGLTVSGGNADGSDDDGGGGLFCDGSGGNTCSPALAHVAFTENAARGIGGAVFADGSSAGQSSPVFANATFSANSAGRGGAVYAYGTAGQSSPVFTNASFSANSATNGGAVHANGSAGGESSPVFTNATFSANSATNGGAVYADGELSGLSSPVFTNASFSANSATNGGAVHANGSDNGESSPVFTNATFSANSATDGGAVFANGSFGQSSPRFENSVLWGNTARSPGGEVLSLQATPVFDHAVVEGGCGSISGATCSDVVDQDPLFVDAEAGDLTVQIGSPAIDLGDADLLPADTFDLDGDSDTAEPLPLDLAGGPRVLNRTVDAGAFERFVPEATVSGVDLLVDTVADDQRYEPAASLAACTDGLLDGDCTLREAIAVANADGGLDRIGFEVTDAFGLEDGVATIVVASGELPAITDDGVSVDGYTQPGASANTQAVGWDGSLRVELDGAGVPRSGRLLAIEADDVAVRGLALYSSADVTSQFITAIDIRGDISEGAVSDATVQGVVIGLRARTETGAAPTGGDPGVNRGIEIEQSSGVQIGGVRPQDRVVIAAARQEGVEALSSSGITIEGSYVGTDASGTVARPSVADGPGSAGVSLSGTDAQVGGTAPGAGNVIAGRGGVGIAVNGGGTVIEGNRIGVGATGGALGNGRDGVFVSGRSVRIGGTAPGAGNIIANNADSGVFSISGVFGGAAILGNEIRDNGGLGIDYADGFTGDGVRENDAPDDDNVQNFPVVESATATASGADVAFRLQTNPGTYGVELFASDAADPSGNGEGARFLGAVEVTVDASGTASRSLAVTGVAPGEVVTATATSITAPDTFGRTSEFSAAREVARVLAVDPASTDANEGEAVTVPVALSAPAGPGGATVSVALTGGTGSADDLDDSAAQTATFAPGATTPTTPVRFTIADDGAAEPEETLVFSLQDATGATVGPDDTFTVTVAESVQGVTLAVAPGAVTAREGGPDGTVTVTLTTADGAPLAEPATVTVSQTDTPGDGVADNDDFAAVAGAFDGAFPETLTLPAGTPDGTLVTLPVVLEDDGVVEGDETATLEATSDDANVTITGATVVVTLEDGTAVAFETDALVAAEGDAVTVRVTLSRPAGPGGESVEVVLDTATSTGDAADLGGFERGTAQIAEDETTGSVVIAVTDDRTAEPEETFALVLENASVTTVATPDRLTLTVVESLTEVTIAEAAYSAAEADTVEVVLTLQAPAVGGERVDVVLDPDASTGTADDLGGSVPVTVVFAAEQTTATVRVPVTDDGAGEPEETFTLALANAQGLDVGDPSETVVTVAPSLTSVRFADAALAAAEGGEAVLTVVLGAPAVGGEAVTVAFTGGDPASATADDLGGFRQRRVEFAAGETQATVRVPVTDDGEGEEAEAFTFRLRDAQDLEIREPSAVVVTVDPSTAVVAFAVAQTSRSEGAGVYPLALVLSDQLQADGQVEVVLVSGAAADLGGFTGTTVDLPGGPAGPVTVTVEIPITDDGATEGDETFVFELRDASGNAPFGLALGLARTALVVLDDDGAPLTVTVSQPDADGGPFAFAVPVNGLTAGDLAAIAGADVLYTVGLDGALVEADADAPLAAGQVVVVDVAAGADLTLVGTAPMGTVTYPANLVEVGETARVLVAVGNPTDRPIALDALLVRGGTLADVVLVFDTASGAFRPVSLAGLAAEGGPALGAYEVVIVQVTPEATGDDDVVVTLRTDAAASEALLVTDAPFSPADGETAVVLALRPAEAGGQAARRVAAEAGDTVVLRLGVGAGSAGTETLDTFDGLDVTSPLGGTLAAAVGGVPFAALALGDIAPGDEVTVPLVVSVPRAGSYEIALGSALAPVDGRPVVIEVLADGVATRLTDGETLTLTASGPGAIAGLSVRLTLGAAVSDEEALAAVATLSVFPNPSAGTATVSLALAEAGPIRVSVVDALGREVAVLHDGAATGELRLAVDGLAPGAYIVQARGARVVLTRGLTVAR